MSYNHMNNSFLPVPRTQINHQERRRSDSETLNMAGSLFSHILQHLNQKDDVNRSPYSASQSQYLLTPQKAGAFTRLTPTKRDNDCSSTSSTANNTPRIGALLARPIPVYLGSGSADSVKEE